MSMVEYGVRRGVRKGKTYTKYLTGWIPAGGEATVLEVKGAGCLIFVNFSVDGTTADANKTYLKVESDGEAIEHVRMLDISEVQWGDFGRWSPKIFRHKWDDSAYVYGVHMELNHSFNQYCKVILVNGDSSNDTAYRCLVMHNLV